MLVLLDIVISARRGGQRFAMSSSSNAKAEALKVLGLADKEDVSMEEIRVAYRKLSLKWCDDGG